MSGVQFGSVDPLVSKGETPTSSLPGHREGVKGFVQGS